MDNKLKLKNITVTFKPITRAMKDSFLILSHKAEKNLDKELREKYFDLIDKVKLDENWIPTIKDKKLIKEFLNVESEFQSEAIISWIPFSNQLKEQFILSVCDNETMNDARDIFDFLDDVVLVDDVDNMILINNIIQYIHSYWKVDKKK